MKRKIFLITALTVTAMNSYAIEIQHGKLLKHVSLTTSKNIKLSFIPSKSKITAADYLKLKQDVILLNNNYINVTTKLDNKADNINIKEYENAEIYGDSNFIIANYSTTDQTYNVIRQVCIFKADMTSRTNCSSTSDEISLSSNGYAMDNGKINSEQGLQPGSYKTYISTIIINEQTNDYFASSDDGTITVEPGSSVPIQPVNAR